MKFKLAALNDIEDRINSIVQLLRALYPNFSQVAHAETVIHGLIDVRGELGYLQDAEEE